MEGFVPEHQRPNTHIDTTSAATTAMIELTRMNQVEDILCDHEAVTASMDDTGDRIAGLFALTMFYQREFGIPFEKRNAYRQQLLRVVAGDVDSLDNARDLARERYARLFGSGLPRTMELVDDETWNRTTGNGSHRGRQNRFDSPVAAH